MGLTEEQKQLLVEHRCFKCKAKQTKTKTMGPFGMMDSYKCKRCIK
jgi:hypothetical protein